MEGLYFFTRSDRLRNCRGGAVTHSQSVTATAFPAFTQQEGSTAVFCQTHWQHNSSIHCLFLSLFCTTGHSFLFRFSICMRLCRGMLQRQKQTASMWMQSQVVEPEICKFFQFRLCLYENLLTGTVSGGHTHTCMFLHPRGGLD